MIKALIIDDEKSSRDTLRGFIENYCDDNLDLAIKRILFDSFDEFTTKPTGHVRASSEEDNALNFEIPHRLCRAYGQNLRPSLRMDPA